VNEKVIGEPPLEAECGDVASLNEKWTDGAPMNEKGTGAAPLNEKWRSGDGPSNAKWTGGAAPDEESGGAAAENAEEEPRGGESWADGPVPGGRALHMRNGHS
jgi:hypothetical protein